jgi:hypothetical protein
LDCACELCCDTCALPAPHMACRYNVQHDVAAWVPAGLHVGRGTGLCFGFCISRTLCRVVLGSSGICFVLCTCVSLSFSLSAVCTVLCMASALHTLHVSVGRLPATPDTARRRPLLPSLVASSVSAVRRGSLPFQLLVCCVGLGRDDQRPCSDRALFVQMC